MALAQQSDPELSQLQTRGTVLDLHTIVLPSSTMPLICDMSTGNPRPFVPESFRCTIFNLQYLCELDQRDLVAVCEYAELRRPAAVALRPLL